MNFIEKYLEKEHLFDLSSLMSTDKASLQDAKLEFFYKLFVDLEKKYVTKLDDMKRIESEHKNELNELESYVYKVKQLTEEREKLTIDFKEENDQLKNKIKLLERDIANNNHNSSSKQLSKHDKLNRLISDTMSSFSDDEFSEDTINMLVLEGFGNIVSLPTHQKIAVLLADREKLNDEIKRLKCELDAHPDKTSKLNKYTDEIEALKLVNDKLTRETIELKNQIANLEDINKENEEILLENINYKSELDKMKANKKPLLSAQTSIDYDEDTIAILEASKIEIAKLKEDNINLKLEIDKLYDEIGQFEFENKQLRDESKKFVFEVEHLKSQLDQTSQVMQTSDNEEIKKLKQEILDLNNELDDLVQIKDTYDALKQDHESLKLDYDKLNATIQLNSEKLQSALKQSKHETVLVDTTKANNNIQLELQWIKNENAKLVLELEKEQTKLKEKTEQYNVLKQELKEKDEQMNTFITKYEAKETSEDDLLKLQKRIIDLEQKLAEEKETHLAEMESNEERQKDLLKRNDQMWSQSSKLEKNYKEAMEIMRQQTERITVSDKKITELEKTQIELDDYLKQEKLINENLHSKKEDLELKLTDLMSQIDESKEANLKLTQEMLESNQKNEQKIKKLQSEINDLNEQMKDLDKLNFNLKLDVDSLNKEKAFIIGQNESTHQKVLHDYLNLQEKYTSVNYEFNKVRKDNLELEAQLKERDQLLHQFEYEKNQLGLNLKQETRDKADLNEKLRQFELTISKNLENINELTEKLHRVEIQKSKLEIKAKELETMEAKCEQITSELNDKRETLSQVLEKNGKLEVNISDLEHQLNTAKHSIIQSETVQSELNHLKEELMKRVEETIKLKHEFETEKSRREKAESRIEELKEEYKKLKQRLTKLQEENTNLKHETIDAKNQLEGFKSKLNLIADKNHTESEKNNALQDELSELKKLLELSEIKCASYSDKFDLLLKKYETRKIKQKNKIERLWDYLQRERVKYKELLLNAQNDLTSKKSQNEKENEYKQQQQENSYQQIVEEKSKLIAVMVDKDAKMREMKRQNAQLQSKIKLLEDEMESLHDKIDTTLKERNKLRKEIQMNLVSQPSMTSENLDSTLTYTSSPVHKTGTYENANTTVSTLSRAISSTEPLDKSFKSTSSLNYWNELNNGPITSTSAIWDINYNTGYISKLNNNNLRDSSNNLKRDVSVKNVILSSSKLNAKPRFYSVVSRNDDATFGGSMATDLNSSTPRTFR